MRRKMLYFVSLVMAFMLTACGGTEKEQEQPVAQTTGTPTPTVEETDAITPVVIDGIQSSSLVPLAKLTGEVEKMPGTKELVTEKKEAAEKEKQEAEEKAKKEAEEQAAKEQAEAEEAARQAAEEAASEAARATETPTPEATATPAPTATDEPEGPWEDPELN